uniref:KIND domain-containing protein n=1 Tax=Gopherus evgoodei TaxID=1825980 RepID=A0A8C4WIR2_9SAUR
MGNGESKKLDYSSCEWRNVTKVSLGEFLRCFDQPISEEQAWALCFQCCHKMKQLAQGPYPVVIKGLGSILIHSDGAVSFMVYPNSASAALCLPLPPSLSVESLGLGNNLDKYLR